jgi:hypothetical protein
MCWKCDAIAVKCRIFSDPFWMEVTRPCEIVSSDEFHSISQELIWDYFPEEVKEAPPGCTEAEQQPAACRPVIIKQGRTALKPDIPADLEI